MKPPRSSRTTISPPDVWALPIVGKSGVRPNPSAPAANKCLGLHPKCLTRRNNTGHRGAVGLHMFMITPQSMRIGSCPNHAPKSPHEIRVPFRGNWPVNSRSSVRGNSLRFAHKLGLFLRGNRRCKGNDDRTRGGPRGISKGLGPLCASAALSFLIALGGPVQGDGLSIYGSPGLIDMPGAAAMPDGQFALTTSGFGATLRNTLSFQIMPGVLGTFRYSVIDEFLGEGSTLYDRSFDIHFTLLHETATRPGLSFGLRDFGGTGVYSSEYLVVSKAILPGFSVTAGLGWGRLGERNGLRNPLSQVSEVFGTRRIASEGGIATTGRLDADVWLKGDVAFFGGLDWQVTEGLSLVAEYSSDPYSGETERGLIDQKSPFNFGLRYAFSNGITLGAYSLYGSEVGAALSFVLDPKTPAAPGGIETAPAPLLPRDALPAHGPVNNLRRTIEAGLANQGLILRGLVVEGSQIGISVENNTWPEPAQAVGRAARVLSNKSPAQVTDFSVTFVANGVPLSTVTLKREDLEALEHDIDGAWRSRARAGIADDTMVSAVSLGPRFSYGLGPYVDFSFFDPDSPVRADAGLQLLASYSPSPGFVVTGRVSQPLVGNVGDAIRVSDSVLPHVRSDAARYSGGSGIELNELTAAQFFRPGRDMFGRATLGYLEPMFAGVSGEMLWRPLDSRFALGADLNYVWQRDFDQGFGFQDYSVLTGHVSAYRTFANGFEGQVDVGRYLAGDYGATFRLDRRFGNGFRVGAFFTLTDVSFEEFGEGSFDKGIVVEVPLSWLYGTARRDSVTQVIRPVLRDGGAQLLVSDRLYEMTRAYRSRDMTDGWGKFWR